MGLVAQENKTCGNCLHYISSSDRCDKTYGMCYHGATPCKYFTLPYNACGNCKHFLGGGDWNLCCDVKYDLVYEQSEACESYERMEGI